MRSVSRTVPAPASLGVELVSVPEGAELELDIQLERVTEGVLVTGTVRAPLVGECARCLELFASATEVRFTELFTRRGAATTTPTGIFWTGTCSTSSRPCATRWCSSCRSRRCAPRIARGSAPSAASGWPTRGPDTATRTQAQIKTPDGTPVPETRKER